MARSPGATADGVHDCRKSYERLLQNWISERLTPNMTARFSWKEIRERRVVFAVVSLLAPLGALVGVSRAGPWAVLGAVIIWIAALFWLRAARCPECREQFLMGTVFPFSERCGVCGSSYASVVRVTPRTAMHTELSAHSDDTLTPTRRRIVGGTIAVGGAIILIGHVVWPNPTVLAVWQSWSLIGFSVISIAGGVALLGRMESGYSLARFTLWAQTLTFVLPGAAYKVRTGPYGDLVIGSATLGARLGWEGSFLIWVGPTTGWEVSVNLLALALLAILGRRNLPTSANPVR